MPDNDALIDALKELLPNSDLATISPTIAASNIVDYNPLPTSQPPISDEFIPPSFQGLTPLEEAIYDVPGNLTGRVMDLMQGTNFPASLNFQSQLPISIAVQQALSELQFPESAAGGGGGGGGGGFAPPAPITWNPIDINVPGAPEWWQALAPSRYTPTSEYITLANLFIPFLSPEDQRTVATNIFQYDPEFFGHLDPEAIDIPPPTEITTGLRSRFLGAQRAQDALAALTSLVSATGREREDFGPGLNYLRSIADAYSDFGGDIGLPTRTERLQLRGALDPLLAQGKRGALAAFGPLARAFSQPFFTAGQLDPTLQLRSGESIFGQPNPLYF